MLSTGFWTNLNASPQYRVRMRLSHYWGETVCWETRKLTLLSMSRVEKEVWLTVFMFYLKTVFSVYSQTDKSVKLLNSRLVNKLTCYTIYLEGRTTPFIYVLLSDDQSLLFDNK